MVWSAPGVAARAPFLFRIIQIKFKSGQPRRFFNQIIVNFGQFDRISAICSFKAWKVYAEAEKSVSPYGNHKKLKG
jgi:hypothetical protein